MKYIFKPKNRIECISRHGDYHGFFVIKNIELVISAKNPRHYLNAKSYKKDSEN